MCSASVKCESPRGSMPECIEKEQLEAMAFSRKRFLNLPLETISKFKMLCHLHTPIYCSDLCNRDWS